MSLVLEAHPAGSINAVQIGSRPICISLAAFLQLELFRVYIAVMPKNLTPFEYQKGLRLLAKSIEGEMFRWGRSRVSDRIAPRSSRSFTHLACQWVYH